MFAVKHQHMGFGVVHPNHSVKSTHQGSPVQSRVQ
jgi:hypothetical protein